MGGLPSASRRGAEVEFTVRTVGPSPGSTGRPHVAPGTDSRDDGHLTFPTPMGRVLGSVGVFYNPRGAFSFSGRRSRPYVRE